MIRGHERIVWLTAFAAVLSASFIPYILTPKPYWDVELVETRQEGGWRYLTVNFVKGDCERKSVAFVGLRLGLWDDLTSTWEPLDGVAGEVDRIEGAHTLSGRLYTGATEYERFEIRTRHICGEKRVDRTVIAIEAEQ